MAPTVRRLAMSYIYMLRLFAVTSINTFLKIFFIKALDFFSSVFYIIAFSFSFLFNNAKLWYSYELVLLGVPTRALSNAIGSSSSHHLPIPSIKHKKT